MIHDQFIGVTAFCKGGGIGKPPPPPAPPRPEDAVYGAKATVAARQRMAFGFGSSILAGQPGILSQPPYKTGLLSDYYR